MPMPEAADAKSLSSSKMACAEPAEGNKADKPPKPDEAASKEGGTELSDEPHNARLVESNLTFFRFSPPPPLLPLLDEEEEEEEEDEEEDDDNFPPKIFLITFSSSSSAT